MSKPFLRFVCGTRILDLNDQSRYWLSTNFVPPEVALEPQFAGGSSANITGGAKLSGWRAVNKSFSFTVGITGTSDVQINSAVRAVNAMLYLAGDEDAPLYLEYNSNSDMPEPLWGQIGSTYRYEVVFGTATLSEGYLIGVRRSSDINLDITLTVKPYAIGKSQRICSAIGGIFEDTRGTTDGQSRGVFIPEATTNLFTNPVFGHATYDNGWTTGAGLTSSRNSDPDFLLFGFSSAKLTGISASNNSFTQSLTLTVATYTISCYVKRSDSVAVTSSDAVLYYASTGSLVTTFTSVGNGWYRMTASFTGVASAQATGILVALGRLVYVEGFQVELKAYATPLAHGAMFGNAWAGTGHASTTTRTAGRAKIQIGSGTFNLAQGCVRYVIRFDVPNTHPNTMTLWDTRDAGHTTSIYSYFNPADDVIYFTDGVNTASSAGMTFAAGEVLVLHYVWGTAGLKLYINGVLSDDDPYTIPSIGADVFIGSNYLALNNIAGMMSGFTIFDVALTATQVASDYTAVTSLVTAGQRVDAIPWFWTISGDNILSLDTNKNPLGVVGGVPGSAPADTEMQGHLSSNWSTIKSIALSNFPCAYSLKLQDFYSAVSATTTVNGAGISLGSFTTSALAARMLESTEFYIVSRLYGSAATSFYLYDWWAYGGSTSDTRLITPFAPSNYRLFRTKPNVVHTDNAMFNGIVPTGIGYTLYGSKNASNVDITVAYMVVLPRPALFLANGSLGLAAFYLKRFTAHQSDTASNSLTTILSATGDVIEFEPGLYNHLQCYFCPDETVDPATTYQATLDAIFVTPRYALL